MKQSLITTTLLLTALQTGAAAAASPLPSTDAGEEVKEYLTDPRRVGALIGNILGGAATAHPAGPLLGGVVGYLIGHNSKFTPDEQRLAPNTPATPEKGESTYSSERGEKGKQAPPMATASPVKRAAVRYAPPNCSGTATEEIENEMSAKGSEAQKPPQEIETSHRIVLTKLDGDEPQGARVEPRTQQVAMRRTLNPTRRDPRCFYYMQ